MSSGINILLSSNYKYLKYASVLIESIYANIRDKDISIYYVYFGEYGSDNKLLEKRIKELGGSIQWLSPDLKDIECMVTNNYFSSEVYSSLFPHLWLPEGIDRILYLDIDTIVLKDFSELYFSDFDDKYLIASSNFIDYSADRNYEADRIKKGEYFNSGVLIYNIEALKRDIDISYYDYVMNHSDEFFFDQGMLNYLFYNKTKYVDSLIYNYRHTMARKAK